MKHARPTRVAVNVDQTDGHLRIIVRDDGCGFEFNGRRDHQALNRLSKAPRSLFDRVTALGGQMSIDSSPTGRKSKWSYDTNQTGARRRPRHRPARAETAL
jgi:signal transduction histidine kinase